MWFKVKNNAPPPKKGSMYLPVNEGIYGSICGISFDFPPLYLIIGFILIPTSFAFKLIKGVGSIDLLYFNDLFFRCICNGLCLITVTYSNFIYCIM